MPPVSQTWRVRLQSELAPAEAVLWLRGERRPFALVGDWLGCRAVLGSDPAVVAAPDCDPFALLDERPNPPPGDARVGGGWVGLLGYGLGARLEQLPPSPPPRTARQPFSFAFYDHVVVHDDGCWWFEALPSPGREAFLRDRLQRWQERMAAVPDPPRSGTWTRFTHVGGGAAAHTEAVAQCRRRIVTGELLQANLCMQLEASYDGELVDLFAAALPSARPRFAAFVGGVVSLSPERFLRRSGRIVMAEPIKGTRPRDAGEQSAGGESALLGSAKDAAEHVMIVDLMRNDLGRVCRYGTVTALPRRLEPHAGVWHLVSTVRGELRDGVGDGDLLRATFPPGSVTGAPKVQAMKVISELESTRRELYTGAIGIASPLAGLDLNVAIRSFETADDDAGRTPRKRRIWIGVGGGIVADSDPEGELEEAIAKARGPIAAVGAELAEGIGDRVGRREPDCLPDALGHGERPDPALGVFETLLVLDGQIISLQQHLARLATSIAALYGRELDRDRAAAAASRIVDDASASDTHGDRAPARLGRLRIIAAADGALSVTVSPVPRPQPRPLVLAPFVLPGGLGAHKWLDRRLLDALTRAMPGTVPLLVDLDGQVLEAAHANVWIREGRALITPPADGRILAGVTRAGQLADLPDAREAPIDLERLAAADAVVLTSSIAGRRPAVLARGHARQA